MQVNGPGGICLTDTVWAKVGFVYYIFLKTESHAMIKPTILRTKC